MKFTQCQDIRTIRRAILWKTRFFHLKVKVTAYNINIQLILPKQDIVIKNEQTL